MSQSPVETSEFEAARSSESAYRKNLAHLNSLLRHGGTLSGHEANCAFLNLSGGPFATVSSVAGFDYLDDARGLALVDWDADGDLDVWTSNRTGPRIRFLRNEVPNSHHYIAVRLEGRTCNRDAIGARVEIQVDGESPDTLIRSVRAGEGFLSQSSKWLSFGLGTADQVTHLTVRWPDGQVQRFSDVAVDQHYTLIQGQPSLRTWRRPPAELSIHPTAPREMPPAAGTHVRLARPIPFPRFGTDSNQLDRSLLHHQKLARPVLINLWGSSCTSCLTELEMLGQNADRLRAAPVDVLAICVDRISPGSVDASLDTASLLNKLHFPFATLDADDELIQRLATIQQLPFKTQVDLSVPMSFLVDSQRRVAAIYRGPLELDELLSDVATLPSEAAARLEWALPLPGRWNRLPQLDSSASVAEGLVRRGKLQDARDYLHDFATDFSANDDLATLRVWLGDELLAAAQPLDAIEQYQLVLQADPTHLIAMNNLAWQLATHPETSVRNGQQAVHWAELAAKQTQARDVGVLDTLAASYAEVGRFDDAVRIAAHALQMLSGTENESFARRLAQRLQGYRQHQPYRQRLK